MKSLVIAFVACLSTILGFSSKVSAAERTRWIYEGGSFENKMGTKWVEHTKNGDIDFEEVTRNRDFVEIYDRGRELSARLYRTKMVWRTPSEDQWNFLYNGRWRE
jgi:hypothetical protein